MVVTVKEAKKRMEELQEEYNEFLKLHNYALCLDLNKSGESTYADSPEKDARRKVLETIKKNQKQIMTLGHYVLSLVSYVKVK